MKTMFLSAFALLLAISPISYTSASAAVKDPIQKPTALKGSPTASLDVNVLTTEELLHPGGTLDLKLNILYTNDVTTSAEDGTIGPVGTLDVAHYQVYVTSGFGPALIAEGSTLVRSGESKTVPLSFKIPEDAAPGTYQLAIVVRTAFASDTATFGVTIA